MFDGTLDRPLLKRAGRSRTVEFECGSGYEKYFTDSEGQRLADGSHQAVWLGEQGLIHVTGINRTIIRSEEHTSELQSLMRISYAVFCLKKTNSTLAYSAKSQLFIVC